MKKYGLIIAGLMLLCGVVIGQEVTSVNVVGYNKATLPADGKFIAVGLQFDAFDQTLLGVLGTNQLRPEIVAAKGTYDRVYIFNPTTMGYDIYRLTDSPGGVPLHYQAGTTTTNPTLVAGECFWVRSAWDASNSSELVLMGEVVDVQEQQIDIVSGFQMLAYPFSSDIALNDTDFVPSGAQTEVALTKTPGDKIYVWDAQTEGYDIYVLKETGQWALGGVPTTNVLALGQGFWYKSMNTNGLGFTWSETNRYLDNL